MGNVRITLSAEYVVEIAKSCYPAGSTLDAIQKIEEENGPTAFADAVMNGDVTVFVRVEEV